MEIPGLNPLSPWQWTPEVPAPSESPSIAPGNEQNSETQAIALGVVTSPGAGEDDSLQDPGEPMPPAKQSRKRAPVEGVVLGAAKEHAPAPTRADALRETHVSEQQLDWLLVRLGSLTDDEAIERYNQMNPESQVDQFQIADWRAGPAFQDFALLAVDDKVGAAKQLATQTLPRAMRGIQRLLESPNERSVEKGVTLALRMKGLLIDTTRHEDPVALARLVNELMTPGIVDVPYIEPRP